MPDLSVISPEASLEPSLNYQLLRAEGLTHLQRLSGKVWTDHNTHDPGITLLEAACYALTELGYRINMALSALDEPVAAGQEVPADWQLGREQVLSSHPLTDDDFGRLLLDFPSTEFEPLAVGPPPLPPDVPTGPEGMGIARRGREANALVISGTQLPRGAVPFLVSDEDGPHKLHQSSRPAILSRSGASEFLDDAESNPIGLNDGWVAPGKGPIRVVHVEFTDPDLNHFVRLHKASEAAGRISPPGAQGKAMMISKARPETGTVVFQSRSSDHDMELALPDWAELHDTAWMNPNAVLRELKVGEVRKGETSCLVTAKFTDRQNANEQIASLRVMTRSASPPPAGTILETAIQDIISSEADKGLFEFFHQKMIRVTKLRESLATYLHGHRNLGEFFIASHVLPLPVAELAIVVTILIDDRSIEKTVEPKFRTLLEGNYRPRAAWGTPAQLLKTGASIPDAYEGYTRSQSSSASGAGSGEPNVPPATLCASDVLRLLMSIEGVRIVDLESLTLFESGLVTGGTEFFNKSGRDEIVRLDTSTPDNPQPRARLRLGTLPSRRQFRFGLIAKDEDEGAPCAVPRASSPADVASQAHRGKELFPWLFPWAELAAYHSFQHDLPAIYGLKTAEAEGEPLNEPRQKAWQLRGYLTFFDQILANAHAQLAFTPQLFTPGTRNPAARQTQELASVPGLAQLIVGGGSPKDLATADAAAIDVRSSQLLDHLLARFGQTSTLIDILQKETLLADLVSQGRFRSAADLRFERGATAGPQGDKVTAEFHSPLHQRVCHLANQKAGDICVIEAFALKLAISPPAPILSENDLPAPSEEDLTLIVVLREPGEVLALKTLSILHREAPAHLALDIRWAGDTAFAAFKSVFDRWRAELAMSTFAEQKGELAQRAADLQSALEKLPKPMSAL